MGTCILMRLFLCNILFLFFCVFGDKELCAKWKHTNCCSFVFVLDRWSAGVLLINIYIQYNTCSMCHCVIKKIWLFGIANKFMCCVVLFVVGFLQKGKRYDFSKGSMW